MRLYDARLAFPFFLGLTLHAIIQPAVAFYSLPEMISSIGRLQAFAVSAQTPPSMRQPPIADATVDRYLLHPLGDVEGLLLSDGVQMHVTARAARELVTIIQPGDRV